MLLFIFLVYFVSRIIGLNNFPIFTDEAIYLRWAQIAKDDAAWRFISLTDGKQPLFIWLTIISMKIIKDPIIAGRMVSVLSGFFTIMGLFVLGKLLFNRWKVGLITIFMYVIFPFALVYDRMALMDGLLGTLMVWTIVFEILLVKKLRLDIALLLGFIIGFSALTKTSGFFGIYLMPIFSLLFNWNKENRIKRLCIWICLASISILLSEVMYSVLRLSPFFHIIGQKDQTFIFGFSDWIKHPFVFFLGNLKGLFDWTFSYLTIPLIILILYGFINFRKLGKEKLLLFLWFIIPLTGLGLFGKVIYPRYINFMVIPLILIASHTLVDLYEIKKKLVPKIILGISVCLFIIPLKIDKDLIFEPIKAQVPFSDSHQYFNDWPSGWGIQESISFFTKQAENQKISVYTEGTFGQMPAALELYLKDDKNIKLNGLWPVPSIIPEEILQEVKTKPVYMTFSQYDPPPSWKMQIVLQVKRGNSNRYFTVYQIEGMNK